MLFVTIQRHYCALFSRLYLKEEHKAKKGRELDSAKWTVGSFRATVSQTEMNDASLNWIDFHSEINVLHTVHASIGDSPAEKWQ